MIEIMARKGLKVILVNIIILPGYHHLVGEHHFLMFYNHLHSIFGIPACDEMIHGHSKLWVDCRAVELSTK